MTGVILPTRRDAGLTVWELCYGCVPFAEDPLAILAGSTPSEPGQRRPADDSSPVTRRRAYRAVRGARVPR